MISINFIDFILLRNALWHYFVDSELQKTRSSKFKNQPIGWKYNEDNNYNELGSISHPFCTSNLKKSKRIKNILIKKYKDIEDKSLEAIIRQKWVKKILALQRSGIS